MKKIISMIMASVMAISTLALCSCGENADNTADDGKITVGVVQYVSHPSLDNCYAGVEAALTERFGENIEIIRQVGSDSAADSDCSTYAKQFAAQDVDMLIPIATPAAAAAFAAAEDKDIPVVFCAVSDPVAAGLCESLEKPGFNCSGTSDVLDMEAQVKLIKAFLPEVKTIGVIYTTSEANSITQLQLLTAAANAQGIEVVATGIQNDSDIPAAATALCEKVDCLNNFTDNKVVNNLTVLLEAANNAGIPIFGSEVEQVKNGCLASVSIDYVALGKVTGNMAADALEGTELSDMAVKTISDATPVVNTEVLAAFGMELPEDYDSIEKVVTNK